MNITLDMTNFHRHAARFDSMSLRERALVGVAVLGILLLLWNFLFMQPLASKQQALQVELEDITTTMTNTATAMEQAMAPRNTALAQIKSTQTELQDVDHQLATTIAGMIAPERMAEVIRDVLHQQHGLTLVSMRNQPVQPLIPPQEAPTITDSTAPTDASGSPTAKPEASSTAIATNVPEVKTGPYVHPLEVIVEGSFPDIVNYLESLETMKWHVYWNRLELETKRYPANRVRIEMSTLSLDDAWLGI